MTDLLARLRAAARGGRKLIVPYVMAGTPDALSFGDAARALAARADALEVGIPYSDPLMDGPVIAGAAERALRAGVGPRRALELAGGLGEGPPTIAMTYYNPVHRWGEEAFCRAAARAGCAGLIVPDLPLEESEGLRRAAAGAGLAWVPLVAPTTPPARVARLTEVATGFVYAVSTLGVTGTRDELAAGAARVVAACRAATDLPVLVGVGVSSPAQARVACEQADGVVIGSALVRLLLDEGVEAAGAFLDEVRAALES